MAVTTLHADCPPTRISSEARGQEAAARLSRKARHLPLRIAAGASIGLGLVIDDLTDRPAKDE
jgi:hypothetical protein